MEMQRLLDVKTVAEILNIKVSTVRAWLFNGRLPKVKVGRCVRIPSGELKTWIEKRTYHPPDHSKEKESRPLRRF